MPLNKAKLNVKFIVNIIFARKKSINTKNLILTKNNKLLSHKIDYKYRLVTTQGLESAWINLVAEKMT